MSRLLRIFTLILSFYTASIFAQLQCPPLGPILPAPTNLNQDPTFQQTISQVVAQLQNFSSSLNTTALSVGARSIHADTPLLDFHHTPSVFNRSGTHHVDGNTVYSIGSATKLITALSILQLQGNVSLTDSVTKYIPRLKQLSTSQDPLLAVDWDGVTLESLASHLSGIGADLNNNVIPYVPGLTEETGLPPLTAATQSSLSCGGSPGTPGCSWNEFFDTFGKHPPVYAPFTTPVYSNIGYSLLGRVIENVTSKTYAAYLQDHVFKPAGMTRSSVGAPPNSSVGFIPYETNWWGTSLGYENSSGGIYSTTNDLLSLGTAILSAKNLGISPSQTRAWMKPNTFTSSSGVSVGMPWEIARSASSHSGKNLTSDGRIIDFYTKTGNLVDYTSMLALVPDYDLVVAINFAGPDSSIAAVQAIFSMLVEALVPAVDQVGKSEAAAKYTGTYTGAKVAGASNATASSMTLAVDEYGLVATSFIANGVDVLGANTGYSALVSSNTSTILRLYPTNLSSSSSNGTQTAWRVIYQTATAADLASFDESVFFPQGSCQSWTEIDLATYGMKPLDWFVLTQGKDGIVVGVQGKAWGVDLQRDT